LTVRVRHAGSTPAIEHRARLAKKSDCDFVTRQEREKHGTGTLDETQAVEPFGRR
jgi:hypothetical protein